MAGATVAALLVAKVVLIADKLPLINRFPEKPLMYNVLWKTVIYVAVSLLAHYLEHLVPLWWRMGSFAAANEHMWAKIVWPHFWAIQLWLVVLIFVYCAMRELVRVIGRQRVSRSSSAPRPSLRERIRPGSRRTAQAFPHLFDSGPAADAR